MVQGTHFDDGENLVFTGEGGELARIWGAHSLQPLQIQVIKFQHT